MPWISNWRRRIVRHHCRTYKVLCPKCKSNKVRKTSNVTYEDVVDRKLTPEEWREVDGMVSFHSVLVKYICLDCGNIFYIISSM